MSDRKANILTSQMEGIKDQAMETIEEILLEKEEGTPQLNADLKFGTLTIKDVKLVVEYESDDDEEVGNAEHTLYVQVDEEIPEEGISYEDQWTEMKEIPPHIVVDILHELERENV